MLIAALLRIRVLVVIGVSLLVATTAYAFAATNVVPNTNAGDGFGTISGYTVSSVTYGLNTADPSRLASINMTVTPDNGGAAPASLKVQLVDSGAWYDGTKGTGNSWTVNLSAFNVSAQSVTKLRVVAAD